MRLTYRSMGAALHKSGDTAAPWATTVALAGNPNVGKSTVFNALTGLKQHTGNWPGKTVATARGSYEWKGREYHLVDLPGIYSLMANSEEEVVARDFLCFGRPDATVVVADATALERNLNLVLQILEITPRVIVCVNLLDEAEHKKIRVNLAKLAQRLGVPVVGTAARAGRGLAQLSEQIRMVAQGEETPAGHRVTYDAQIAAYLGMLEQAVQPALPDTVSPRWVALQLLDDNPRVKKLLDERLGFDLLTTEEVRRALDDVHADMKGTGISADALRDRIVSRLVQQAQDIYIDCVTLGETRYQRVDRRLDKLLTSKATGIPAMLLLMAGIFWLTLQGANYPSRLLGDLLFGIEDHLMAFTGRWGMAVWAQGLLIQGVYRTLAWVVSVMLPPMAIFFPLFTLLEDAGYLPRIAFNLDHLFQRACAHGKQALTTCMGFGCNACGVIGCRIIDSPRERLIAILTNNFVPCNGRFPTLVAIIAMFFAGGAAFAAQSVISTLFLLGVICLGVAVTLLCARLLSKTILKGLPSSFALELPPYRKPQIGKVIVRSIFDRTLFVLGRAAAVAAPAGLLIWVLSNVQAGGMTLLAHCTGFLDPFARLMGLDGVILMAFILGFPANEIVIPVMIMAYMAGGSMVDYESLAQLKALLISNGWTWLTAACTMLFSLMHYPCGTTCWTIYKETKSWKWTGVAVALPTALGMLCCMALAAAARLLGLAG
ncbi:MAG: ferrous iron transport protein B [Eubacteriales bacterium]|nr:ferrous iron transport protein B [Eubacteriales bacterium]